MGAQLAPDVENCDKPQPFRCLGNAEVSPHPILSRQRLDMCSNGQNLSKQLDHQRKPPEVDGAQTLLLRGGIRPPTLSTSALLARPKTKRSQVQLGGVSESLQTSELNKSVQ